MKNEAAKKNIEQAAPKGKILTGTVVSDKMQKTIVVEVTRFVKHPKYQKYQKRSKRYKVHDEKNEHKVGEIVDIQETRPMSRHKTFTVITPAKAPEAQS